MRNYLLVLLRTLQRDKLYAALNIAGLSLGVACCVILGLFLYNQLTYDRHNVLHERIYRIADEFTTGGASLRVAITPRALAPMLAADYPDIKAYVRFTSNSSQGSVAIHHGTDTYYWENSYFADDNVFQVFTHHILYGDPMTALREGSNIAVSATFAHKYFGNSNPIGQIVSTDTGIPTRIALVFDDLPSNSHLKYDILFSSNLPFMRDSDNPTLRRQSLWNLNGVTYTYLVMTPGFDPARWQSMSQQFFHRYMEDVGRSVGSQWNSWLQPLAKIHLWSDVSNDRPTGSPMYLYACSAVALFILIVACINYMNLATARATRRARSVGIRKVLGANRAYLTLQFLGEGILFALIAVLLGVVLVEVALSLTSINNLLGGQVHLDLRAQPQLALWLVGLALVVGVASGLYPALYLSSWAPLAALTGKYAASKASLRLREGLVLLQFTISVAVIATTLLMTAQMHYLSQKSLGFAKENRVVVNLRGSTTIELIPTIRKELAHDNHVLGITEAQIMLGRDDPWNEAVRIEAENGSFQPLQIAIMPISENFATVMGIPILHGRDYTKRFLTDIGMNVLVNEALVRRMGWSQPLGKRLNAGAISGHVIGVVRDFNFKSLHTLIEPLILIPLSDDFSNQVVLFRPFITRQLVINISGQDVSRTLAHVEKVMAQVDPRHPFEYSFLDENLDNQYKAERQLTGLMSVFAFVCIFIACLGLFGLAAFTTEQRTREIGTRKVLGASALQIIVMLARRILILVAIAAALASVISYFSIDAWLGAFAYRAAVDPLIFLLSAAVAALVAFTTVALQSYKAASMDPVKALRHVE